jgi:hypothetical protein
VAEIPLLHKLQPWEIEKQRREEAERFREYVEQEAAVVHTGVSRGISINKPLQLKKPAGAA